MVNYNNGIIYKICCKDLSITDIYVGSTTNFNKRKQHHKERMNVNHTKGHYKIYKSMRDNGGFNNWSLIEIEKYPCDSKRELEKRERYWIDELKPTLNSLLPYVSESETKERIINYRKSDARKQTLENEKVKVTCDCGDILNKSSLSRHLKRNVHKINMSNLNNNNNNNNI